MAVSQSEIEGHLNEKGEGSELGNSGKKWNMEKKIGDNEIKRE